MLAYMDRTTHNSSVSSGVSEPRMLLGFSINDLTILIGAAIGAAGLILIILTAVVIWHCCKLRGRPNKAYCLDNSTPDESTLKQGNGTILQSDSVVFLGSKTNQVSTRAVGIKSDICQSILTRSQSVPLKEGKEVSKPHTASRQFPKRSRPTSQPVHLPHSFQPAMYSPKRTHSVHPHNYHRHVDEADMPLALPSIPEVAFRSSEILHDAPPHMLYASCNALDGPCIYSSLYTNIDTNSTMKTRSLPLWGRSRPRPLSTEDDLNELYAKVSFSKKRKNRMHSDSAAAIAVNKSRSSYLTIPFTHKDTDSLVDNEAVVVYDERTAL
ncbi:uncharacterized protein LOC118187004 isoform X2 [Stegodyphus dumicola]|uniref:uncharacterized protein LOC118187004 isoform X2 n=1 Tax=Stegodyphus dumicola TaxID=202533 RepID=UPI0015AA89DC|nr:uncharacterized protein LOC118187004 isoform X2 [Stegodyphus dumicola]